METAEAVRSAPCTIPGPERLSSDGDVAERLGDFNPMPGPYEFTMADGRGTITVSETINLDFPFGDARIYYFFFVVDELAQEMIIGTDMMQRWKMKPDFDNDDIDIDPIALQLII